MAAFARVRDDHAGCGHFVAGSQRRGDDSETSSDFSSTRTRTRVIFQPTFDSTHTIFYKGHYLHITRSMHPTTQCTVLTVSVVARSHNILKDLVKTARKGYEAASVHKIQLFSADAYGGWRYSDVKHKRPLASVVLEPGVKERVVADARDFLASEKTEAYLFEEAISCMASRGRASPPSSMRSPLSWSWTSTSVLECAVDVDDRLQQLLGVVPKGTMVLLEDLDAAFTRSTTREEDEKNASSDSSTAANQEAATATTTTFVGRRGRSRLHRSSRTSTKDTKKDKKEKKDKDRLNDVNTLSLSGLLNALDGVAASEGRLLFA
ncbi:P-loop containing nucleoside triphosphate hydrolase protein [Salix suchowensis]|nr:P-loop containing nucleoside triphosphate hydrolase protein [Salix suchowensis]